MTVDPWYLQVYSSKETTNEEKPQMLRIQDSKVSQISLYLHLIGLASIT
jgi:hypothetical protein